MLRFSQPVAPPFAPRSMQSYLLIIRRGGYDYAFCIEMRDLTLEAIRKALKSGVAEYHVGSRGLKRYSLKELRDELQFWIRAADDAALGVSAAIQTRRGVPCDL